MTDSERSDSYRYVSLSTNLDAWRDVSARRDQRPSDPEPRIELRVGDLYLCVDENTAREIRAALEEVLDGVATR